MIELKIQLVEEHIQKEDTKGSLSNLVHLLKYNFTRICPRSGCILCFFNAQDKKYIYEKDVKVIDISTLQSRIKSQNFSWRNNFLRCRI